jgi:RNA polymerase sigma-70 factor (ECF subfamily)
MKHISNYEDRGVPFSAWLYRIAHNLVANFHRDNSRKQIVGLDEHYSIPAGVEQPESVVVRSEEEEFLLSLVEKLPDDRQQLLILKFVDHLSNSEIGEIMGRTEGAIKSLYHRTLLALRDEVRDLDINHPFLKGNGSNSG